MNRIRCLVSTPPITVLLLFCFAICAALVNEPGLADDKKVGKQHDWNDLEILAQGNRVRVAVNGTQVVDWRDPEPQRIKEGPIGLQLHSNNLPQEVHFKELVLETFPEDKLTSVK